MCYCSFFFLYLYGDHRDLHVLTHSFPTRRSSDLTIAKAEQEKANVYTKELFAYCRRFKEQGSQFRAIAGALAAKAVDSLPDGLREGAQALMPIDRKSTRLNSSH